MSIQNAERLPTGGRRFLFTVLAFAFANAAIWIVYLAVQNHFAEAAQPTLRVERFAPGEAQSINQRQPLIFTFNADVGPPQPGPSLNAPGVISPAIAGKWAWSDRRTLLFTPDADYPKATRFTLTLLPQKLVAPMGMAAMPQPFVASVQTPALQVAAVRHVGMIDSQPVLELSFNDAVLASDVIKHVTVTTPAGKPCKLVLNGKANGKLVRVRCEEPANEPGTPTGDANDRNLSVTVTPGLAGAAGPLGLEKKESFSVHVTDELTATGARANCPPDGQPEVSLSFNGSVKPTIIQQILSIDPPVPFLARESYNGSNVNIQGDFAPGTRYSLTLKAAPAGGGHEYPKPGNFSVFVPDRPATVWLDHEEGYLGARGNRTLMAHAVNVPALRVTIIRVYDNTLVEWRNAGSRRYRRADPTPYARPIVSKRIDLPGFQRNKSQDVRLALDELLPSQHRDDGVYRIAVEPESAAPQAREYDADDDDFPRSLSWQRSAIITLSDIGLSAKQGRDGVVSAWAVSLSSGKPIDAVRVRLFSSKNQLLGEADTAADGLATLKFAPPAPGEQPAVLIADLAVKAQAVNVNIGSEVPTTAQLTWLDLRSSQTTYSDADTGGREFLRSGYEAFVYTDRGVYRPGDTVNLRAILRGSGQSVPQPFPVKWQLRRPDLHEWKSQVVQLDADGSAGLTLVLPTDLPTGRWTARIGLPGETRGPNVELGSVTFQIEEYIPERIKASLAITAGAMPAQRVPIDAKDLKASLQADYLFGRPAARLPANLSLTLTPTRFSSSKWSGWTFGDIAGAEQTLTGQSPPTRRRPDMPDATTNDNGHVDVPLDLVKLLKQADAEEKGAASSANYHGPWELSVASRVHEEGGRGVIVNSTAIVDTASHYLGVRLAESSPRAGSSTTISIVAVKPSGEAASGDIPVVATLYREQWNNVLIHQDGHYHYQSTRKLERVGEAFNVLLKSGRGQMPFTAESGGSYVLHVEDPVTKTTTSIGFYAVESSWQENISRENPEKIDLILLPPVKGDPTVDLLSAIGKVNFADPDALQSLGTLNTATKHFVRALAEAADASALPQSQFKIHERPRVLIRSPFAGQLLLCIETDSVVSRQVIEMTGSQMIVPIDVPDACRPNAFVTVSVVRAVDPNASWRSHRAFGVIRLPIDAADRRLTVSIDTPTEIRPQQTLTATLHVADDTGHAISGAAVTVAAVDEGILQLTNFKTPDPLAFFLSPRALGVKSADLYSLLMPEVPKPEAHVAVGGDDELHGPVFGNGGNARTMPISARRVKSVALFSGVVHTDASGNARVDLPVPEFTGRLRLMAVSYSGTTTDSNASRFGSGAGETIVRSPLLVQMSLPRFATPGDRFVVPMTIFNNVKRGGNVKLRIALESSENAPVLQIGGGNAAAIDLPEFPLAAGAQVSRSVEMSATQAVGVAKIHLSATMDGENFAETVELPVRPPSQEMTDGGFIAAGPEKPAKIAPPDGLVAGTRKLQIRVTPWPSLGIARGLQYLDRYPYGCAEQTLSTTFPLVYLGEIGPRVAPGMFDRERIARNVQTGILRLLSMQTSDGGIGMWPGNSQAWPWASIYAAHFLIEAQAAGHPVPEDFREHLLGYCRTLLEEAGDEPGLIEQQAYASYVLSLAGKPPRATMNRLTELLTKGEAAAYANSSVRWHLALAWVSAGRRDLATSLVPLILPKPGDLRQQGGNLASPLRDRALLLQAMVAIDPKRPEVTALAMEVGKLLDSDRLGTQEAAAALCALGRYLKVAGEPPAYDDVELWAGDQKLASADHGQSLTWDLPANRPLPKDLQIRIAGKPHSQAFVSWLQSGVPIQRPADADSGMTVRRKYFDNAGKPTDPSHLNSGDLVRVELTVSAPGALQNVVIEDLLPAGLEVENPRLQSGAVAETTADKAAGQQREKDVLDVYHTDIRDDRVTVMGSLSSGGKGRVSYLARAVSPGTFVVAPVRAECMYDAAIHSVWTGDKREMKVTTAGEKALVAR